MRLYKSFVPAVSVILPTYNRSELLVNAIDSVIRQTISNWELVIVDDGSSDDSFEKVRSCQEDYENIRYIRHSNRKLPLSLNTGLLCSSGKYITFLGSDDTYKPEHLQLRLDVMESNPDIDMIHGGLEIIGNPYVKDRDDLSKEIHLSECAVGGTFFGYREVFLRLKGFNDLRYSEDSEFFDRVKANFLVRKIDFPTYVYNRNTPDSITNNI
jgi:glycosyltransferase involved in cell wall biosynthesis